jgi:three-Cys-motif partner protein
MATSKKVTWDIEPHTRAKHEILKRYLQAWFPIMTQGNRRVIVLDGFAGPGEYEDGSQGSPIIAIETLLANSVAMSYPCEKVFYFIEADPGRCDHLQALLDAKFQNNRPANVTWEVVLGKFDEHMTSVLDELDQNASMLAPTFAFLDPFGYSHTPLAVVSRLMRYPKCEVFINFMFEEANRFMSWDNPAHDKHYDALFGTSEWRKIRATHMSPAERERQVHDLYASQLKRAAGATYVRSFRMRNKNNRPDYFLFFGTKNLRGLDRMKQAMWKVDPSGAYDFSDTTNPAQQVLIAPEPDFSVLRAIIKQTFSGQAVTVQEIEDFVIEHTAYSSSHYRRVLKLMEQNGELEVVNPPSKRKIGTYRDMSIKLRFL